MRPDPGPSFRALRDLPGPGRNLRGTPSALSAPSTITIHHHLACRCRHAPSHRNRPNRAILGIKISWRWGCPRSTPTEHAYRSEHQNFGPRISRNHVIYRAILGAVPGASPWSDSRNCSPGLRALALGARGQIGTYGASPGPTPLARGRRGRLWICRRSNKVN